MRMLGLFMIMPVIAILAPQYPDHSPWLVGLAIGGYGLTQALLQIPMGVLSDKIGRKAVIAGGLVLFIVGSAVAALADTLWGVVLGRVLQGAGAIAGAIMALAADISREHQRSKVMAIIGIAIGLSFYLAVIIGPIIAADFGLAGIFAFTACFSALCLPLLAWGVPKQTAVAPQGDTLPNRKDVRLLLGHPSLWRLNMSVMLLHCLITAVFVQLPTLFIARGWALAEHWKLYLPVLLASVLGMGLLLRLQRKLLSEGTIKIAILSLALACACMGFASVGGAPEGSEDALLGLSLGLGIWIFFSSFNYLEASFPSLVSAIAPAGKKGSAMGVYASCQFFGAFVGGVLAVNLAVVLSPEWVLFALAAVCLLWLLIFFGVGYIQPVQRHTLSYTAANSASQIQQALLAIDGVLDVAVVDRERTAYLKVDSQVFDLLSAQQAVR